MTVPEPKEPTLEEYRGLRALDRAVDEVLERALQARDNLERTFRRLLPVVLAHTSARAAVVSTIDEELRPCTWSAGAFPGDPAALLRAHPEGVAQLGPDTFVSQRLDVGGQGVGHVGLLFDGAPAAGVVQAVRLLDAAAEQLDGILRSVQLAAEKHQLILACNTQLALPVFEHGMDGAVAALCEQVRLPGLLLIHRDPVDTGRLHYRTWRNGRLEHDDDTRPAPSLDAAVQGRGLALLERGHDMRGLLGAPRTVETVLVGGAGTGGVLGKLVLWSDDAEGFDAFTLDVASVLAAALSQRLVDYNRERVHLSQFFPSHVIDRLLEDPDYSTRWLSPREEPVGILFADINGFTRLCEQALEGPAAIGTFVDRWSEAVVRRVWAHGGVFDKMVGDCVIGLFGPPFFQGTVAERAAAAVRTARDIQQLTAEMSADREVARMAEKVKLPGLGVAIGVNLAATYCGLFGPNRNYTGFSSGMNQAARLQSLGGFRETLVMDSVREALAGVEDASLKSLRYGPLQEQAVKNVARPLRYHAVGF
jgi:adenylate cyclase